MIVRPAAWSAMSPLGGCDRNTSDHMPGAGNSTSATLRKLEPDLREQRLENLLHGLVDRPHDRHAVEQALAELDQRAADQVGGEEAEQRQRDERDDQAGAGDRPRQIGFRAIGRRDERPHDAVDPGDERPDQPDGDRKRPGHHQAGEEIVADAAGDAGLRAGAPCDVGGECSPGFVSMSVMRDLFHRDRFREIARLVDVGADGTAV